MGLLEETYRIYTPTVCLRKALLDQVVAANPYELAQPTFLMGDTPRWLELARITRFAYTDESLATYRLLPESASQSRDRRLTLLRQALQWGDAPLARYALCGMRAESIRVGPRQIAWFLAAQGRLAQRLWLAAAKLRRSTPT